MTDEMNPNQAAPATDGATAPAEGAAPAGAPQQPAEGGGAPATDDSATA